MTRYKSFSFGNLPDFADPNDYYEDYEHLFDMVEKKHICSLTEPEDRTFSRDLAPLIKLLNEMSATTHNSDSRAIAAIQQAIKIKELWQPPNDYGITENNPHYEEYVALQKMLNEFESVVQQQHT
jgi:hypothetical protein